MADYKKMYLMAVDAIERAMELLAEAEQACEELYIQNAEMENEAQVLVFPDRKTERDE